MAQEKIIIRFDAVGEKGLIAAVRKLDNSIRELQGKQAKYNEQTVLGVKNNRLLNNSFATLRSQLLLFNFAMAMGVRQLIEFVGQAAKVEAMGMAFDTLSGGAESGSIAIEKLRVATNGTMNQFDLFQQANNAMILGVSRNSNEMAEMFDIAQRLGRALGRDTASSVESLITGIGRQSRLMLDNIGIIVKAEEAYQSLADSLGVNVDALTDAEKKQAFLQATMESARKKVAKLGDEVITNQDSFDRLKATVDDLNVSIGTKLKGAFASAADAISDFVDNSQNAEKSSIPPELVRRNALVFNLFANALRNTNDALTDTHFRNQIAAASNGDIGESFEALGEDLSFYSFELLDRALVNFDNYIKKQKEVEMSNQNTSKSYMSLADAFAISSIAQERQTKAIVQSSFETGIAYNNAGKAAEAAGQQVIQSLIQQAVVSLMADAVKKLGWIGVPLAATAGAVVGSLVGQAQRHLKFEQGGLIGGRRHSQGGTIIEAEQGEFVMSRNAVESIGIENLNRMNQTGGGGTVTVNVSGNVMSQDFVEGELAEQIKEAVRRGTDFGIS